MNPQLRKIVDKINDRSLREKVAEFVENPSIKIEGRVYTGLPLETSPAGLSHHHSYPGGFIEHVVSTAEIASALCKVAKRVYGGKVNRDQVLAGVILHDIFKPLTYVSRENGSYGVAPLAERLDHLTLIVAELVRRGFSLNLVHIACSHMGYRYGPIGPRTAEALIVHLADMADSRLNGELLRAARFLTKEAVGMELERVTAREALEIINAKTEEGWEAVGRTLDKIRERRLKMLT